TLYNPEAITQYSIVPGLLGVVLTMTMTLITGLAITRERESGTMENLLSMPTRPLEVMLGKLVPYILVGYLQVGLILLAALFMFPFRGMPRWAQVLGEAFPLTHFLRIVRGVMLKGIGAADVAQHLWPILAFLVVVLAIGVTRYRRTLD